MIFEMKSGILQPFGLGKGRRLLVAGCWCAGALKELERVSKNKVYQGKSR
jgi:hypothetical protein